MKYARDDRIFYCERLRKVKNVMSRAQVCARSLWGLPLEKIPDAHWISGVGGIGEMRNTPYWLERFLATRALMVSTLAVVVKPSSGVWRQ